MVGVCSYIACMPAITIRHVPEETRRELAKRAANGGRSLQEYLLGELNRLAERPAVDEVIERARRRVAGSTSSVGVDEIIAARDADRR